MIINVRTINPSNFEFRASDGKPILEGDVFYTATKRVTTPVPSSKYMYVHDVNAHLNKENVLFNNKKKIKDETVIFNQWLINNVIEEAKSRNDDYNLLLFGILDVKNLSYADTTAMNMYLFGYEDEQPKVYPKCFHTLYKRNEDEK